MDDDGQASPTKSEGGAAAHDVSTASPHTTVGDGTAANGRASLAGEKSEVDADGAPKAKRRRVAVACKSYLFC